MATLSKAQFKEQLKDPEVASIKRDIRLFRKIIKEYNWMVISHNNKKRKCFELKIVPRNDENREAHYHYSDQIYYMLTQAFKNLSASMVNDMGDIIKASVPYHKSGTNFAMHVRGNQTIWTRRR